jgi:uncharacterized protein with PIN domain
MQQVTLHFHGRLVNYLAPDRRLGSLDYTPRGVTAVKHPIEALGVPHTEVECILANGHPVSLAYSVQGGDRLDVYADIPPQVRNPIRLRPAPPQPLRFLADNHLGRLVTYLRLLGFDVLQPTNPDGKHLDDAELAEMAADLGRVLLSRDRRLLMRKIVVHGFCLQSRDPYRQLTDVLDRYDLHEAITPWKRCLRCNGRLHPVDKEAIIQRLEPKTKKYYHEFHICQECHQIYWKGSHYGPLHDLVSQILDLPPAQDDG